eukprot:scaffold703_cov245-Pinguiococcus_pyrenoidosus.AAC.3
MQVSLCGAAVSEWLPSCLVSGSTKLLAQLSPAQLSSAQLRLVSSSPAGLYCQWIHDLAWLSAGKLLPAEGQRLWQLPCLLTCCDHHTDQAADRAASLAGRKSASVPQFPCLCPESLTKAANMNRTSTEVQLSNDRVDTCTPSLLPSLLARVSYVSCDKALPTQMRI